MSTPKPTPAESYAQLLSLAVHEFRTPASVVSGYLRMLQRDADAPLSDRHRKMVDEAEKSCARLVALVAELSEVSKLDAGLTTIAKEPLELFALLGETAEGVREGEDRGVRLVLAGASDGARILGDAAKLRSAFTAIFRAILREQPAAGTVVVDRRVDTRGGVASAMIVVGEAQIIEVATASEPAPFDEKRGGLGLALPIARRIIGAHGGRVWSPAGRSERGAALVSLPLGE